MEFRSGGLNNYVTKSALNDALENVDTSINSQDFKDNLSKLIDSSQGLFWDSSTEKLTINAYNINGSLIQGVKVRAGDIEAGTLNGLVGDGIKLNDVFITQAQGNDVGQLGSAKGSYYFGDEGKISTYGSGMTAGNLQLAELGSLDGSSNSGAYSLVTNMGFRAGYFWDFVSNGAHNRITINLSSITLTTQSSTMSHSITLDRDGNLSLSNISNITINNKPVKIQYIE